MILRAMRLCIPLRNWLDEQILQEPGLECLDLSNIDWKKLRYLIVLLRSFAEYTNLIRNTNDATINHTWNIYNALFNHLDMIQKKLNRKDLAKTPWIPEFIRAVDISTEKFKEYYSKTSRPVEMQYALAAMLDPSQKLSVFRLPVWGCTWSKKYQKEFIDYWGTNYQNLDVTKVDQPRASMAPQTLNGIFRQHWHSVGPSRANTIVMNKVEQYL